MRKYGQRELKTLVRSGAAVDISNHDNNARHELEALEGYLDKVGV